MERMMHSVFSFLLLTLALTLVSGQATGQGQGDYKNQAGHQNVFGGYPYGYPFYQGYQGYRGNHGYHGNYPYSHYGYPHYRSYYPYNYGYNHHQHVPAPAPPKAPVAHVPVPHVPVPHVPAPHVPVPHAPAPGQVYHGGQVFIGQFAGTCEDKADGLYYIDERSFAYCTGGRKTIQPCAGGSANPDESHFKAGERYQHYEFCSINLAAQL